MALSALPGPYDPTQLGSADISGVQSQQMQAPMSGTFTDQPLFSLDPGLLQRLLASKEQAQPSPPVPGAGQQVEPAVPSAPQVGSSNNTLVGLLGQLARRHGRSSNSGLLGGGNWPAGGRNPFGPHVTAGRIDQGVDISGRGNIGALGPGVILQYNQHDAGWPGGGYIAERITRGPNKGKIEYLAENVGLNPNLHVGSHVGAGDPLGFLRGGAEMGWAAPGGTRPLAQVSGGYSEGQMTRAGLDMARMLEAITALRFAREGRSVTGYLPRGF